MYSKTIFFWLTIIYCNTDAALSYTKSGNFASLNMIYSRFSDAIVKVEVLLSEEGVCVCVWGWGGGVGGGGHRINHLEKKGGFYVS